MEDGGCLKHFYGQPTTLGSDATLNTEIHKNSVRIKAPNKFCVNWPFGSKEDVQNRFPRWSLFRLSWISDRNDFNYF